MSDRWIMTTANLRSSGLPAKGARMRMMAASLTLLGQSADQEDIRVPRVIEMVEVAELFCD